MIKEIATFIEGLSDGPPWVLDIDFFAGHIPTKNKAGNIPAIRILAVLENAGGATIPEWPDYVEKAVQLWNRNDNYFEARDDAMELYKDLHGTEGWNLPGIGGGPDLLVMVIDATSPPAPIANPDEEGNYIFSCNYLWRIEEASCGS